MSPIKGFLWDISQSSWTNKCKKCDIWYIQSENIFSFFIGFKLAFFGENGVIDF